MRPLTYAEKRAFWQERSRQVELHCRKRTIRSVLAWVPLALVMVGLMCTVARNPAKALLAFGSLAYIVAIPTVFVKTLAWRSKVGSLVKPCLILWSHDLEQVRAKFEAEKDNARRLGWCLLPIVLLVFVLLDFKVELKDFIPRMLLIGGGAAVLCGMTLHFVYCVRPLCRAVKDGAMTVGQCKRLLSLDSFDLLREGLFVLLCLVPWRLMLVLLDGRLAEREVQAMTSVYSVIQIVAAAIMALVALVAVFDIVLPLCCQAGGKMMALYLLSVVLLVVVLGYKLSAFWKVWISLVWLGWWNLLVATRGAKRSAKVRAFLVGIVASALAVPVGYLVETLDFAPLSLLFIALGVLTNVLLDNLVGGWTEKSA